MYTGKDLNDYSVPNHPEVNTTFSPHSLAVDIAGFSHGHIIRGNGTPYLTHLNGSRMFSRPLIDPRLQEVFDAQMMLHDTPEDTKSRTEEDPLAVLYNIIKDYYNNEDLARDIIVPVALMTKRPKHFPEIIFPEQQASPYSSKFSRTLGIEHPIIFGKEATLSQRLRAAVGGVGDLYDNGSTEEEFDKNRVFSKLDELADEYVNGFPDPRLSYVKRIVGEHYFELRSPNGNIESLSDDEAVAIAEARFYENSIRNGVRLLSDGIDLLSFVASNREDETVNKENLEEICLGVINRGQETVERRVGYFSEVGFGGLKCLIVHDPTNQEKRNLRIKGVRELRNKTGVIVEKLANRAQIVVEQIRTGEQLDRPLDYSSEVFA